jgi:hypothetical protein
MPQICTDSLILLIIKTKNLVKMHPPGLEPGSQAWKASIIPLDQGCFDILVF